MSDQITDEQLAALNSPFNEHYLDQFNMTMAARGYPIKTAEEAQQCLELSDVLMQKAAAGQLEPASQESSVLTKLASHVASTLDSDGQVTRNQLLENIQQKVASAAQDPFVMYATAVRRSLDTDAS